MGVSGLSPSRVAIHCIIMRERSQADVVVPLSAASHSSRAGKGCRWEDKEATSPRSSSDLTGNIANVSMWARRGRIRHVEGWRRGDGKSSICFCGTIASRADVAGHGWTGAALSNWAVLRCLFGCARWTEGPSLGGRSSGSLVRRGATMTSSVSSAQLTAAGKGILSNRGRCAGGALFGCVFLGQTSSTSAPPSRR